MRANLYLRISKDSEGKGLGVRRQRDSTRRVADDLGATSIAEYVDNDRSASNGHVRENYARMLADVRAGAIGRGDVIVAYNQDRLCRDTVELETLIGLCRAHGVGLHTQSGELNVRTADGRTHARLLGVIARAEAEKMGERMTARIAQNAANGLQHGPVAYGWRREPTVDPKSGARRGWCDVIEESEAEIVREIARRIVAGDSISAITQDLNDRGVPTARRAPAWTRHSVRSVVSNERNIGRRVYRSESGEQATFPAAWEPILDESLWRQVVAVLTDPSRRTFTGPGRQPRHLLSNVARCGVCGAALAATTNRRAAYRCFNGGHTTRQMASLDEYVTHVVIEWASSDEARELLAACGDDRSRAAVAEAERLRAKLRDADEDFLADRIGREQHLRLTANLRPQIEQADRKAAQVTGRPVWADLVQADDPAEMWKGWSLDRQRAVIRETFEVTVHPRTNNGSHAFDASTVDVVQRSAPL